MVSQKILSRTDLKLSTVEMRSLVKDHYYFHSYGYFAFLLSLPHFPHFFTCDSQIHFANTSLAPNFLSQGFLLFREPKPEHIPLGIFTLSFLIYMQYALFWGEVQS